MPNIGVVESGEKGERVANEPDVMRIKREKRERHVEPVPASSMTRRRFLTYLGGDSSLQRSPGTRVSGPRVRRERAFHFGRTSLRILVCRRGP